MPYLKWDEILCIHPSARRHRASLRANDTSTAGSSAGYTLTLLEKIYRYSGFLKSQACHCSCTYRFNMMYALQTFNKSSKYSNTFSTSACFCGSAGSWRHSCGNYKRQYKRACSRITTKIFVRTRKLYFFPLISTFALSRAKLSMLPKSITIFRQGGSHFVGSSWSILYVRCWFQYRTLVHTKASVLQKTEP